MSISTDPNTTNSNNNKDNEPLKSATSTPTKMSSPQEMISYLHYGDIIEVHSRKNPDINDKHFLVDYLDETRIRLVQIDTFATYIFYVTSDGEFVEREAIDTVELLTRAKERGYARQKGLIVGRWIDIYFLGVDKPITGEITDLIEDQIEVMLYPSREPIYIDFAYRGLPEDLKIERFVIRGKPRGEEGPKAPTSEEKAPEVAEAVSEEAKEIRPSTRTASMEYTPDNEIIINTPDQEHIRYDESYRDSLQREYQDANEIVYGPEGDVIEHYEERYEKVFSMDVQLESMLDEFLSNIPNAKRTERVMSNIQYLLERYRELHDLYSNIDQETGEVLGIKKHGPKYKPLKEALLFTDEAQQQQVPSWLVPVAQAKRVIYLDNLEDEEDNEIQGPPDVSIRELALPEQDILKSIPKAATINPYIWTLQNMAPYMQPIEAPETSTTYYKPRPILFQIPVQHDNWEAILDNQASGDAADFYTANTIKNVRYSRSKMETTIQNIHSTRHVLQRYVTGMSFLEQEQAAAGVRRKIYVQNREFTPPDTIHIGSWIMMPKSVALFSRIHMPTLTISKRTSYSHLYWVKSVDFRHGRNSATESPIENIVLDDLTKNIWRGEAAPARGAEGPPINYTLDSSILRNRENLTDQELYEQYIDTITPNTFELIEHVQPGAADGAAGAGAMSLSEQMALLEPFLVHMEDLTYTHVNRIRYFMKQHIQSYLKRFHDSKEQKDLIIQQIKKWNQQMGEYTAFKDNMVKRLLDNTKIYDLFRTYKIPALGWNSNNDTKVLPLALSSSEILQHVVVRDYMKLFMILLKAMTASSIIPKEFLEFAKMDYMTALKKMREKGASQTAAGICRRHNLAKHYDSLSALQKDNYQEDVYYDADLDDTPYELIGPYRKDIPKDVKDWQNMENPNATEFIEFLEQNLIQKHGIPAEESREFAIRLLTKKRRVQQGEYAILKRNVFTGSEEERKEIKEDTTGNIHYIYYQRKGNLWVKDTTVEESAFVDLPLLIQDAFKRKKANMNQMFCTTASVNCIKDPDTAMCETIDDAEAHLDLMRHDLIQPKLALQELKTRINLSMEDRMKKIEQEIEYLTHRLLTRERWQFGQMYKWNFAAKYLGKTYKEELAKGVGVGEVEGKEDKAPEGDALKIRDAILAQSDFAKRQHDLVRFHQHFLREPMIETLDEDPAWLYSVDTNHKILPRFLYDLALQYVTRGEEGYRTLLERIKQNQEISDDGHAIVDKNSGFTIAQIEWENEQLYDERGFKIQTGDIMETDPTLFDNEDEDAVQDAATAAATTALESEDTTMVKQIFDTYCRILEILPKEQKRGFSDFVIRNSLEYIEQNIMTPIDFSIQNEALIKKRKWDERKIQEQYKLYYQQYMVFLVTCMFLIGLQTIQPPIKTKKSIPGCVKSFEGYPLTETTDNITGIQYMACILNTVKSSYAPWNAIKTAKREMIQEAMMDQIAEILERRTDIHDLYVTQRTYREQHPEEFEIPREHQLMRWMHLLPPAIRDIDIMNKLAKDRMSVAWDQLTPKTADTIRAQMILYGYGIIEAINSIVKTRDVLLKTAVGIPFLHNACCSDKANQTPLAYFIGTESGSVLGRNIEIFRKNIQEYSSYSKLYDQISKCTTNVFVNDTTLKRHDVTHGNIEELIYSAFIHYCQFDRPDAPVPAHLTAICATKPNEAHYRRNEGLMEKIQDLKDAGKKYGMNDLEELLKLVNREKVIRSDMRIVHPDSIQILTDFLSQSTGRELEAATSSSIIKRPYVDDIRDLLLDILVKYDPQIALIENPKEEGEYHGLLNNLKNYLIPRNQEMKTRILNYLSKYGNINAKSVAYTRLNKTMDELTEWTHSPTHEEFYEMTRFLKNNMLFMCKIMPEMLRNNLNYIDSDSIVVPKHWDLAVKHDVQIQKMIAKYYENFRPFYPNPEETDKEGSQKTSPKDKSFSNILRMISGKLSDLVMLSQYVPVTNPIEMAGEIWFRFMDRESIQSLFSYMWYAVLDQYIEFTETEMQSEFMTKTARRGQVKASKNLVEEIELKKVVASLLLNFIRIMEDDKAQLNLSYSEIMKKVNRDKDVEKRSIMSRFEQVSNSDLRYVNLEKRFKIGRWLMEDVHKYKKSRYEKEKADDLINSEILYHELAADGVITGVEAAVGGEEEAASAADDDDLTAQLFEEYGQDDDLFDLDREYVSDDELDFEGDF